ncbi:TonB family protein [Phenylobacterium sp.]|uniref:TonB family protein n=1 Tax=Phenylobacterium sp. TaxID=1871053 RepID=UPI0012048506|nr:TonB family protein [Phenylobacterium sp.]THD61850.1 MAG: TonB family protein [Phenylobacterium sp.]
MSLTPARAVAAVAALMLASSAGAQPPAPASAPPAQAARWAKEPTPQQYAEIRPAEVRAHGGRAVVRCHVDAAGALSACASLAETPAGSGYAQGLASLAPLFQMKPELVATEAPGGTVVLLDSAFRIDAPPTWLHKPTPADLMAVWPRDALTKRLSGKAVLNCMINLQGALFDCVAISESPAGEQFGAAAVAITPQLLMKPGSLKGEPQVTPVNIPINFVLQAGAGGPLAANGPSTAPAAMAWIEAPSYTDLAAAYPRRAREARTPGHATVNCAFSSQGYLIECRTMTEEPKDQGFGNAALALARRFRAPADLQGKPLRDATVQLPFTFDPAVLGAGQPAVGKPQWAALPSAEETAQAFATVTKAGVGGTVRVMLACTVQAGGAVSDCKVTREDPAGQGVGQAAMALIPHFRLTTWTTEGLPTVGATVAIPLRYEGGAPEQAAAAKP